MIDKVFCHATIKPICYYAFVCGKVLTPNDFTCLDAVAERLLGLQYYWETKLLAKLGTPRRSAVLSSRRSALGAGRRFEPRGESWHPVHRAHHRGLASPMVVR